MEIWSLQGAFLMMVWISKSGALRGLLHPLLIWSHVSCTLPPLHLIHQAAPLLVYVRCQYFPVRANHLAEALALRIILDFRKSGMYGQIALRRLLEGGGVLVAVVAAVVATVSGRAKVRRRISKDV